MRAAIDYRELLDFYSGRRVFITGNTGFKGSWLTYILLSAGAEVTGYAFKPPTEPGLFTTAGLDRHPALHQYYADVRDLEKQKQVFKIAQPSIVLHLAAQPIVRDSYRDPVGTYSTNVMGTVNMLECVRLSVPGQELNDGSWAGVRSVLNVTTDKVYKNNEWEYGYRENEPLDGFDPYSNSKSCSELVTHAYQNSFFDGSGNPVRISTARAGNVIGGGDFANDRIIPDCVRAMWKACNRRDTDVQITVRNPYSIRPYQHVLEPLFAYLMIAKVQYENGTYAGYYNVGPDDCDCVTTGELVDLFCSKWNTIKMNELNTGAVQDKSCRFAHAGWCSAAESDAPHEANFLKLDTSKIRSVFHWQPRWHIDMAISQTVRFSKIWLQCTEQADYSELVQEMNREIEEYVLGNG